jgi:predicted metal-dependent phosphoesterase TrpH
MFKADLHLHSLEDPRDVLEYDAFDLIDHAARLEYKILALTLHGRLYCPEELRDYAKHHGILLISGIEMYLDQREVLILGLEENDIRSLKTLRELQAFRVTSGKDFLVIAPHPFYGMSQCVGDKLEEFSELFDAIELCHFYTRLWNPNRKAERFAREMNKPMIACSDTHRLRWMKHHYCFVDSQLNQTDVFQAIRSGRIRNISRPLSSTEMTSKLLWHACVLDPLRIARSWGWVQRPSE